MKKFINVGILFGVIALIMLLVVGTVGAQGYGPGGPGPRPGGPGPGPMPGPKSGPMPAEMPTPMGLNYRGGGATLNDDAPSSPSGTALRINFEVGGQKACRGLYTVVDQEGTTIVSWYAYSGQTDSGWFENLTIANDTTLVRVLYYPGPDTSATTMTILNPAPRSTLGWVSRSVEHAIEVAWPGNPPCQHMPAMPHKPSGPMMKMD